MSNHCKYQGSGREIENDDFSRAVAIDNGIFAYDRVQMPYAIKSLATKFARPNGKLFERAAAEV